MATHTAHLSTRGSRSRRIRFLLLPLTAIACGLAGGDLATRELKLGTEGTVARVKPSTRPTVEAAFARESYSRGQLARVVVTTRASAVGVQLFRAGTETAKIAVQDEMLGTAVTGIRMLGPIGARKVVRVRIGNWPSGLYYARLTAQGGRVGFAPFVLRPRHLGAHRVAVILPTFSWQAYNFHDDDGDGDGDTWYAHAGVRWVGIGRPYENRGVPPHYKYYDQPFLRWLIATGRDVDFLSDTDLHATTGRTLARAYELLIFPGHHEYATMREFRNIESFRNRGGNLMFLSANNLFWQVVRHGNEIRKVGKFRDLGHPEAAVIGVQYFKNDSGEHRGPWIVRNVEAAPWLFEGTKLLKGSALSSAGIEIDAVASSSPRTVRILAVAPNLFGPGLSAHMTYYETRAGAKVFAAGAFTLAGAVWNPDVAQILSNLWERLAHD
jgi:hypothetical protein